MDSLTDDYTLKYNIFMSSKRLWRYITSQVSKVLLKWNMLSLTCLKDINIITIPFFAGMAFSMIFNPTCTNFDGFQAV